MVCNLMSHLTNNQTTVLKKSYSSIYSFLVSSGNPHLWLRLDEILLSDISLLEKLNLINNELKSFIEK